METDHLSLRVQEEFIIQSFSVTNSDVTKWNPSVFQTWDRAMSELIPPAKPYIPREDIEELKGTLEKILNSGMLTLGEYTKRFEDMFATTTTVKHNPIYCSSHTNNKQNGQNGLTPWVITTQNNNNMNKQTKQHKQCL